MSATGILRDQLLLVSMVVLAFLWAATEWTARRLAFQPQRVPAWFMIWRWPTYQPFGLFICLFKCDAYAPTIFMKGGAIAASGGIAATVIAIVPSVWRAKEAQHVTMSQLIGPTREKCVVRGCVDPTASCLVDGH